MMTNQPEPMPWQRPIPIRQALEIGYQIPLEDRDQPGMPLFYDIAAEAISAENRINGNGLIRFDVQVDINPYAPTLLIHATPERPTDIPIKMTSSMPFRFFAKVTLTTWFVDQFRQCAQYLAKSAIDKQLFNMNHPAPATNVPTFTANDPETPR